MADLDSGSLAAKDALLNHSQNSVSTDSGEGDPFPLSIDEAIERLGEGVFQRKLLWAAGMCNGVNAMAVMLLTILRIVVRVEWDLTVDQAAFITSSVFIGAMVGTLMLGPAGDKWGRKPVFLLSTTLIAVFGLLSCIAPNYAALVIFRFFVGFGVGGTVIPFDTLAEVMPTRRRGRALLLLGYFWTAGTMAVPFIAAVSLQGGMSSNWQLFVFLCTIPCVVSSLFGWLWVPESPRWLMTQGRNHQALQVLRDAAVQNGKDPLETFPKHTHLLLDSDTKPEFKTIKGLFQPEWRFMVLALILVWLGLDFVYWGTIQVVTLVFAISETALVQDPQTSQYSFDYWAIFFSSLAEIAGQTIVLVTVDRWGRVPIGTVMYFFGGICVLVLCILVGEDMGGTIDTTRAELILLAFAARMFMMGATSVTWIQTPELLPTQIRNTGHAVCDAVATLGGAFSPFVVSSDHSLAYIGVVMALMSFATGLCTFALPETMGITMGSAVGSSAGSVAKAPPSEVDDDDDNNETSVVEEDDGPVPPSDYDAGETDETALVIRDEDEAKVSMV